MPYVLYSTDTKKIISSGDLLDVMKSAMRRNAYGPPAHGLGELEMLHARLDRLEEFIARFVLSLPLDEINAMLRPCEIVIFNDACTD